MTNGNHDDDKFQRMLREQNALQARLSQDIDRTRTAPALMIEPRIFTVDAALTPDKQIALVFTLPNGIQMAASLQPKLARALIRELEQMVEKAGPESELEVPGS